MVDHLFPYAKEYEMYLQVERELAEKTVKKYFAELCAFFAWLQNEYRLGEIKAELVQVVQIRRFLVYLKKDLGNEPSTRNNKLAALRSYFEFLVLTGRVDEEENPVLYIRKAKEPVLLPIYLTLEEAESLLSASIQSKMPERDHAMMRFFLQTGCRISELLSLKLYKLDLAGKEVRLLGKGNKERIVPLTDNTCAALKEYLAVRAPLIKGEQAFFLSNQGKPISANAVRRIFKLLCQEAGLLKPNLSPIKLRHTCLTLLLNEGVSLVILKEIAGHETIRTTRRYTHVSQAELRKAVNKFPLG